MKKLQSFVKGKGICSDIYNDIWCLHLYPNGHRNGQESDVFIRLQLCALPPNISKMRVEWTVHCHEANITRTLTKDFDEENRRCGGWHDNTISFSDFVQY
eukprot:1140752_1